jgi:hypothetical protein
VFLTFALVEGLSSMALFGAKIWRSGQLGLRYYRLAAENRHIQYDPMLGWVGMPQRFLPNLYGQGKYLRTDSNGFRSDLEITTAVPADRVRAICTGDSFAFGQGVANDRTWCHLLSVLEPGLQTVNMGQRGYGVDQAFLWYQRDGRNLDHQLLLFSFIGGDFNRMGRRAHHGYGKPVLRLDGSELIVENTPVPTTGGLNHWVSRIAVAATTLRSVELGRRLFDRSPLAGGSDDSQAVADVATAVLRELAEQSRDRDIAPVLIWLPVEREIDSQDVRWRPWVEEQAARLEVPFLDLSEPLRALSPQQARRLFIAEDDAEHLDSAGHYSEEGNAWAAAEIHRRLIGLALVRAVIDERSDPTIPEPNSQ